MTTPGTPGSYATFGGMGYGAELPKGEGLYDLGDVLQRGERNKQIQETGKLVSSTLRGAEDVEGASAQQMQALGAIGQAATDYGQIGQLQREQAVAAALGRQANEGSEYATGVRNRVSNPFAAGAILGQAGAAGSHEAQQYTGANEQLLMQGAQALQQAGLQQQGISMDVRQQLLADAAKRQALLEKQAYEEQAMRDANANAILGAVVQGASAGIGYGVGVQDKKAAAAAAAAAAKGG